MRQLVLLSAVLSVVMLPACRTVGADSAAAPLSAAAPDVGDDRTAYAAMARRSESELRASLRTILDETLPQVQREKAALHAELATLDIPVTLAARHADLRDWHTSEVLDYQARVTALFDARVASIRALFEGALRRGEAAAVSMAAERSPVDLGLTGNPLLDRQMVGYRETLERECGFETLEAERFQWSLRSISLFEAYNSFGDEEALAAIGGRMILFVGGEDIEEPVACLVLEMHDDEAREQRGFAQVMRHRVVRGDTLVTDMGWRALPAQARIETHGRYVIASGLAPRIDTEPSGFEPLAGKRVLVDMQTAVFDEAARLLGGVNWQVEFRVTERGAVSWQMSGGAPAFDAACHEMAALLASD